MLALGKTVSVETALSGLETGGEAGLSPAEVPGS